MSALTLSMAVTATAQQPDDLQQQLERLKKLYEETTRQLQQYDATTRQLQDRISTLEQQIKEQQNQIKEQQIKDQALENGAEDGAQSKSAMASLVDGDQQQRQGELPSAPRFEFLRDAEKKIEALEDQVRSFEFHGYFRSGYGVNIRDGQQVAFQAPGADAKYRLGNETDTYGELILVNNWLNPQRKVDKAWLKTEVMLEANTTSAASFANFTDGLGNDQFRLREAFVSGGNLFERQPDLKVWAGERYYRRLHIEINDFFPLDMSGYGAGIEDLDVGIGKVAVGYLAGARPDIVTNNGNYSKRNLDLRLYDVKAPGGTLAGWFAAAVSKGGTTSDGTAIPSNTGYAFGLRHERLKWHGGYNAFGVQYGSGVASNFRSSLDDPTDTLPKAARLLITEEMLLQPTDRFAVMPIFLYQRTRDGDRQDGWDQWLSFGARPELFFTKYLSLAFEGGFDHTRSGSGEFDGWLRKFTIAPQIQSGRQFFSRPALRAFVTYANWSDGLRGFVGGTPFQTRTNGLTYGVQAETWW